MVLCAAAGNRLLMPFLSSASDETRSSASRYAGTRRDVRYTTSAAAPGLRPQ